jgi:hypothetical protein
MYTVCMLNKCDAWFWRYLAVEGVVYSLHVITQLYRVIENYFVFWNLGIDFEGIIYVKLTL